MCARCTVMTRLVLLLLLVVVGGSACGGSEADDYVGYWRMPPLKQSLLGHDLLQIRRSDGAYAVRFDTLPWHRAELVDGRLQLQKHSRVDSYVSLGVELEVSDGEATIHVTASPSPNSSVVTRLTEDQYQSELTAMADEELRFTVSGLTWFAEEWAETHGGVPPAAGAMTPDSAFGRYVDERIGSYGSEGIITWPWNPFTGEPIGIGTDPGDLSYSTAGREFSLAAYDSNGALVSP